MRVLRRHCAGRGAGILGLAAGLLALTTVPGVAQPPGFGGRGGGGPPPAARDAAPVDLTGTWVSLVTEDWIERMSPDSPASGTGGGFGFGGGGRGGPGAGAPAPRSDDPCAAYGAGGIMRVPGRVRIRWQDENTLLLEYDAGSQRRLVRFAAAGDEGGSAGNAASAGDRAGNGASPAPSLQGRSTGSWQGGTGGGRGRGGPQQGFGAPTDGRGGAAPARWGSLEIETTNLAPGYLLTSRSWYGEDATLTELVRFHRDFDEDYFTVTAVIEENGATTSMTSSTFRREANDSKFEPSACTILPRA